MGKDGFSECSVDSALRAPSSSMSPRTAILRPCADTSAWPRSARRRRIEPGGVVALVDQKRGSAVEEERNARAAPMRRRHPRERERGERQVGADE